MFASASSAVWTCVMLPFSNRSLASKMSWGFRPYAVVALMKFVRFSSCDHTNFKQDQQQCVHRIYVIISLILNAPFKNKQSCGRNNSLYLQRSAIFNRGSIFFFFNTVTGSTLGKKPVLETSSKAVAVKAKQACNMSLTLEQTWFSVMTSQLTEKHNATAQEHLVCCYLLAMYKCKSPTTCKN